MFLQHWGLFLEYFYSSLTVSSMWRIVRNFWCLGCESQQQRKHRSYTNLESSSDYPSSSDLSERENSDLIKSDQIPKPDIKTDKVQPPDIEIIDESEIIGDLVYEEITEGNINGNVNNDGDKNTDLK